MKINDKHLTTFASNNCPVDKEGFLLKRGEVNKAFQKRWFVLKGNLLFYYEKKNDVKEPIGVIILEGCTVELAENSDLFTFELVFQGSGSRTYILSAETQEDMESWMKAITCANYDYMKLMVSELQQKLDEFNAEQAVAAPWSKSGSPSGAKPKSNSTASEKLIDLGSSVDSQSSSTTPQSRFNPFNTSGPSAAAAATADSNLVDLFGSTPFKPESGSGAKGPRTFEEMHDDFGSYIREKIQGEDKKKQTEISNTLDSLDALLS